MKFKVSSMYSYTSIAYNPAIGNVLQEYTYTPCWLIKVQGKRC